jgi:hypothetical protein
MPACHTDHRRESHLESADRAYPAGVAWAAEATRMARRRERRRLRSTYPYIQQRLKLPAPLVWFFSVPGRLKTEIATVNRAIAMLRSLTDPPHEREPVPRPSPIRRFAQEYLAPDPDADFGCDELWKFFQEVVQAGELPPMRKAAFLRQLPAVMAEVYNLRKCHNVERSGRRVRGFRGVSNRPDASQLPLVETKAEPG